MRHSHWLFFLPAQLYSTQPLVLFQMLKKTTAASCDIHEWRPDVQQKQTSASANRRFLVGGRLHCTCSTTLHSHAWTEHCHSWWTEKQGVSWIHEAMLPKRKHLFSGVYYWAYLSINLWGVMLVFLKDWVCRREVCCYWVIKCTIFTCQTIYRWESLCKHGYISRSLDETSFKLVKHWQSIQALLETSCIFN